MSRAVISDKMPPPEVCARVRGKLIEAKALLSTPAHWCRGVYAKNDKGEDCPSWYPDAVSWTLFGACYKVSGFFPSPSENEVWAWMVCLLDRQARRQGFAGMSLHGFDDDPATKHADILALLQATIEAIAS